MSFTLHFQGTGLVPANAQPAKLIGKSLTLGRGEENDVLLPDPDKVISKRHCVIEDHSGNFVVMDISTNGTFLNYSKTPLGKTPTPLSNGDILVMGPFELLVEIIDTPKELIPGPVDLDPVSVGDAGNAPDIDVLLSEPSAGGSGGDFLDDLLGGEGGPAGPSSVAREELGDDGLLAPIGSDSGGLLDPLPEETPIRLLSQSLNHNLLRPVLQWHLPLHNRKHPRRNLRLDPFFDQIRIPNRANHDYRWWEQSTQILNLARTSHRGDDQTHNQRLPRRTHRCRSGAQRHQSP